MNIALRLALALLICGTTWPAFAAADFFWNCTTPDGIKYADATKCDKGDTAVKTMKGETAKPGLPNMVQSSPQDNTNSDGFSTDVCPADPAYCSQPHYGITEGAPRAQAISQFMRKRACDFRQRFPDRCAKSH